MGDDRTLECDGRVVKALRRARGLSQVALVTLIRRRYLDTHETRVPCGTCSLSTLKRIETGKPALVGNVESVASALGIPVLRILSPCCRARLRSALRTSGKSSGDDGRAARTAPSTRVPLDPLNLPGAEPGEYRRWTITRVRLACEERFRKILVDDYQLVEEGRMSPQRYWRSFWMHQWDQFRYWRDGSLDNATYLAWMPFRYREHRDNQKLRDLDYRSGWRAFSTWHEDAQFTGFMELVFSGDIQRAARLYGRRQTA